MKKTFITLAAMAMFLACENMPDQTPVTETAPLKISVGVQTKGLVTESYLPDGSAIGTFFYDESEEIYDQLFYRNIKFTASGEDALQTWTEASMIRASNTKGTLSAYYPYSESVTDKTAIPVSATPSHQVDYMWANPVGNIDYKNASAALSMNHALAAIRLNIDKGGYTGTGEVTKIYLEGDNIAQSATMDATTGALSNVQGAGETFISSFDAVTLSETPSTFEYILVPVADAEEEINIAIVLDGVTFAVTTPVVELKQNTIHEYTLSMTTDMVLTQVAVKSWVNEIDNNPIMVETTQPITAKIKHVDGTLYTTDEWTVALTASNVTNDQVVGVAIPHPENPLEFLCVLHPTAEQSSVKWSSNTSVVVENVFTTTDETVAATDFAGQANTNAILAAVTAGTIKDAPAAQYCAGITFADGKTGYLPAAGEIAQIYAYETDVNACLTACGGTALPASDYVWSSTQNSATYAWCWGWSTKYLHNTNTKLNKDSSNYSSVRVVSAF